jgi:hypothetical protein
MNDTKEFNTKIYMNYDASFDTILLSRQYGNPTDHEMNES